MKKKIHSESEKVKAVHQLESGVDAVVVACEYNISRETLYNWKSKYSGMEISQVKRLKELEDENRKLKQMYADLALDNKILKEIIEKKTLESEVKKKPAGEIVEEYGVSISRACKLMDIHRSYFYYTDKKDDTEVEEAIRASAEFGDGFRKIYSRLRREGRPWNHKKVYRVYKAMHYEKRSRLEKRLPARVKNSPVMPEEPNVTWSIDFISDRIECGRQFRVLNIIDDACKIAVAQEISMSMQGEACHQNSGKGHMA